MFGSTNLARWTMTSVHLKNQHYFVLWFEALWNVEGTYVRAYVIFWITSRAMLQRLCKTWKKESFKLKQQSIKHISHTSAKKKIIK